MNTKSTNQRTRLIQSSAIALTSVVLATAPVPGLQRKIGFFGAIPIEKYRSEHNLGRFGSVFHQQHRKGGIREFLAGEPRVDCGE